ncbi:allantoate permease [Kwoniella heveanensis BCC8398]|uniref:Allantoate permease n=1 Tax=Kwoniella heveanensis BCC8398 TaxID=1296120 RepID=A0A1B9GLZ9_9TREE|nr:allantoate permease [Kwoniella heveanensis BCC8398]
MGKVIETNVVASEVDDKEMRTGSEEPSPRASDDVGGIFLASIAARDDAEVLLAEPSKKEMKALIRKADAIVVTLLQFALMMGSVDKVSIGSAAVLGMRTDTHLKGQEYSWTSAVIYFGAILAIIPSLALMQKLPTNLYISTMVLLWGVITMCMAASKNYADLIGIRFLLGCFESVIFAGFGLIISMWYTREEQPLRVAIVFSTLSSVMNGILATACVHYTGTALAKWQLLFILVGAITTAWSLLLFWLLPANPTTAWWLTLRQRVIATKRMSESRTGMENSKFKFDQALEAVVDPKTWLYFLINCVLNIPNGGLITFNSIIVNSLGFTLEQTTLLGIPTGVFSWISSLLFGYLAVRTKQRCYSAMAACIIPLIGTVLLYKLPRTNHGGSLASLYLVYFYWGPYIVMMGSVYANTAGHTKKMVVYAIAYCGYSVGNIVGPQTFRANQAPKYTGGVIAMLVCYGAALLLIFVYRSYLVYLNRVQARKLEQSEADAHASENDLLAEWHDRTDRQNPRFVYEL